MGPFGFVPTTKLQFLLLNKGRSTIKKDTNLRPRRRGLGSRKRRITKGSKGWSTVISFRNTNLWNTGTLKNQRPDNQNYWSSLSAQRSNNLRRLPVCLKKYGRRTTSTFETPVLFRKFTGFVPTQTWVIPYYMSSSWFELPRCFCPTFCLF